MPGMDQNLETKSLVDRESSRDLPDVADQIRARARQNKRIRLSHSKVGVTRPQSFPAVKKLAGGKSAL